MSELGRLRCHLSTRPLVSYEELKQEGFRQAAIKEALADGTMTRLARGFYASAEADYEPDLAYVAACLVTGGIVCGRTAGMYHGLTDDLPGEIDVLVPHDGRRPPIHSIRIVQSRIPAAFTVGIEERQVLGVTLRMTDKPRTVVDLVRGPTRQHAVAAVHKFLADGGSGDELAKTAEPFGAWPDLEPLVEATLQTMSRSYGP